MPAPSYRIIAEACDVSTATVSRALSGDPVVRLKTRELVAATAKRLGYRRNGLVGAMMSRLRTSHGLSFHGSLAFIHVPSLGQPNLLATQRRIIDGARARAGELGFKLDTFTLGQSGLSTHRMVQVLRARNVSGLILLHSDPNTTTAGFPWGEFTSVEIDYSEREPRITTVCVDHYHTLLGALSRLHQLGYRRMGLFLERFKNDRIWFRYSAAFHAFHVNGLLTNAIAPLIVEKMQEAEFLSWYRKHKPDLVLGHVDAAVEWLGKAGFRTPDKSAFFNLNWTARKRACAGIDWLPELQGEVAAESIIAQIHRHETGLPANPRTTMVRGRWVDGPTLRRTTEIRDV